jgi:hypothetical protein
MPVPSSNRLLELIWELCFPGTSVEPGASLQTVFESAQLLRSNDLRELLLQQLTIEATSVPEWYRGCVQPPVVSGIHT